MDDDQMYPLYPTSRSVPEPLLLSASRKPGVPLGTRKLELARQKGGCPTWAGPNSG